MFTAAYSDWTVIPCAQGDKPRSIADIANDILNETLKVI